MSIVITLLALAVEATLGYPDRVLRAIGHPVMWLGRMIDWLDDTLNRETAGGTRRKAAGFVAAFLAAALPAGAAYAIESGLLLLPFGFVIVGILASTLIAQRSLHEHVERVATALEREGLDGGRRAVSQIVGRDPDALDEAGVARAAIESLAENLSDGVVAPALWLAVGGLAGGVAYKAINTADSMIGHRTPRHRDFGWATARCDDLVNLVPARLAALVLAAAALLLPGRAAKSAFAAMKNDATKHRSPNAGWPEAAMAGALGIALVGPRVYHGEVVVDSWMNESGRAFVTAHDISRGLRLYLYACGLQIAFIALIAFFL